MQQQQQLQRLGYVLRALFSLARGQTVVLGRNMQIFPSRRRLMI